MPFLRAERPGGLFLPRRPSVALVAPLASCCFSERQLFPKLRIFPGGSSDLVHSDLWECAEGLSAATSSSSDKII